AVSAHTDCLIQIVKERRSFCCCGSGILLNHLLESSLIFKGFSRLSTWLSALPLALSMEAHYREQILSGKAKLHVFLIKPQNRSNNKQKEESSS
ncbi:hypothetical protein, partial [Aeromonas sp. HMWF017]|uniref:hypothetical protein n=1 Tax=Aeromonas sp. HMWF017 TaxID=2056853 RepID=UPI001C63101A